MNEEYTPAEKTECELLEELIKLQKRDAVKQLILIIVVAMLTIVLVVAAGMVIPKAIKTIDSINTVVESAEDSIADIDKMVNSISGLVDENMDGISDALSKINEIDIDSLNSSIENMSTILESLSKIANIFK